MQSKEKILVGTVSYPKVGIVVLNWNGWPDTVKCLESLDNVNYSNFCVIVVDNGSTDSSVEKIKAWIKNNPKPERFLMICNNENLGFAGGCNVGIRQAISLNCQYVFLLNNDTIVDTNCLLAMVSQAEQYKDVGIIGPKIYYANDPLKIWYAGANLSLFKPGARYHGRGDKDVGQFNKVKQVTFVSGAAMLIKREVFDRIGLLDERFFFGVEDYDFCRRALSNGYRLLYVPDAVVWHKVGASHSIEASYVYLGYKQAFIFMKKHFHWSIYIPWFFLYGFYALVIAPFRYSNSIKVRRSSFRKAVLIALIEGIFDNKVTREDVERVRKMIK